MILPALYHWSPTERRDAIAREGLRPYSPPTVQDGDLHFPYISLSPTPSAAWGLSGDMEWVSDVERWDLWQVRLGAGDEVRFRPTFGNVLEEVKVSSAIPADRVWYVATREPAFARPPLGVEGAARKAAA